MGLDTLAVALGEEADTVMDVYEPYLIMQGFLKRTPRGRVLTRTGFLHCGLKPPAAAARSSTRAEAGAGSGPRRVAGRARRACAAILAR